MEKGYTMTYTVQQERRIDAPDLKRAEALALILIGRVPGARLISVLRDDVKHEPNKPCPDCVAEEAELKKRGKLRSNWPSMYNPSKDDPDGA